MAWKEEGMREVDDSKCVMPTGEKSYEITIESSEFNEEVQIDH